MSEIRLNCVNPQLNYKCIDVLCLEKSPLEFSLFKNHLENIRKINKNIHPNYVCIYIYITFTDRLTERTSGIVNKLIHNLARQQRKETEKKNMSRKIYISKFQKLYSYNVRVW